MSVNIRKYETLNSCFSLDSPGVSGLFVGFLFVSHSRDFRSFFEQ